MSLKGVTLNGVPLLDKLKEGVDKEVERERKAEIKKPLYYKSHAHVTKRERSSRTRHLTPEQIRKEYGLMSKPHKGRVENIIHCILISDTPRSAREISDKLNLDHRKSSALYSQIYNALALRYIIRTKYGRTYKYMRVTEFNALKMDTLVKTLSKKVQEHVNNRRKAYATLTPPTPPKLPTPPTVNQVVEKAIEAALGIKVEVSGHIEIIIKTGSYI